MLKNAATIQSSCSADAGLTTPLGEVLAPCTPAEWARATRAAAHPECYHCGTRCPDETYSRGEKYFCCQGCLTVFELLTENGLDDFYSVASAPGVRGGGPREGPDFQFADQPAVRERLVDYADDRLTRVTFHVPAIHCIACVWLLENLFRLKPGIGHTQVNFPRKEVAISFETGRVRLSQVVGLLTSLGYEPDLKLSDLQTSPRRGNCRRLWLQLGVAGFAFGNTMLFSIASYLGLDSATGPGFQRLVGILSLLLAIPVVLYSASDYWRSAWISLRHRLLNIDVPIAAGLLALFAQSSYEVLTGHGAGYFDSMCGLLFFLLCGRLFQQKTFDRLAFDRDYRSFFPLSVKREGVLGEEAVALSQLEIGDRLVIRNGELIPADSRLAKGTAIIDYSFVTGESEPVSKCEGDYLYAGGRQLGSVIQVQTVKRVSQSYLTSLWNQEVFQKESEAASLKSLTNAYSQRFTRIVLGIALGAAGFWAVVDPSLALKSFTSVLIVACPCALALAAPFALGSAQRVLARRNVFLKNPSVLERLAAADTIVFDKTGTLTGQSGAVRFLGQELSAPETGWVRALSRQSTHPYAVRLNRTVSGGELVSPVERFREIPGQGMEGRVASHEIWMGSAAWLASRGVSCAGRASFPSNAAFPRRPGGEGAALSAASCVHLAIDGVHRGCFELQGALRPETEQLLSKLAADYHLALLSGDNERDQRRFRALFPQAAELHFNQNPLEKLHFVERLQSAGRKVIMVGDGLNDAGALKQSDVGIAVVENAGSFSPASDVIMAGEMVPRLGAVTRFARSAVRVVRASFLISTLYNVVGIAIAARGLLEPVVCAILMPLSSVTVVAFACGVTNLAGRRLPGPRASASRAEAAGQEVRG